MPAKPATTATGAATSIMIAQEFGRALRGGDKLAVTSAGVVRPSAA